MSILNFIIAVVALVMAIIAYRKAGGDTEGLKEQLKTLREITAQALKKAEKAIRPDEETETKKEKKK
ncbi:hypothetical protein H8E88_31850 [candidate division KSB1 bacterium]|nr:hypothetical protein [candidate division KSB1 bacterium]MBL7092695.1 hypothetical protein [candidate division KSB1 bacterium]